MTNTKTTCECNSPKRDGNFHRCLRCTKLLPVSETKTNHTTPSQEVCIYRLGEECPRKKRCLEAFSSAEKRKLILESLEDGAKAERERILQILQEMKWDDKFGQKYEVDLHNITLEAAVKSITKEI